MTNHRTRTTTGSTLAGDHGRLQKIADFYRDFAHFSDVQLNGTVYMMDKMRIELRAVFYKEGSQWVCHCLEMDVMGDGDTKKAAFEAMNTAVNMQIVASLAMGNRNNIFQPADPQFFEMYASGKDCMKGVVEIRPHDPPCPGGTIGAPDRIPVEVRESQNLYAVC